MPTDHARGSSAQYNMDRSVRERDSRVPMNQSCAHRGDYLNRAIVHMPVLYIKDCIHYLPYLFHDLNVFFLPSPYIYIVVFISHSLGDPLVCNCL